MSGIFIFIGFLLLIFTFIGLIKPKWAWLKSRFQVLWLFVASLLSLGIGGSLLPDIDKIETIIPQNELTNRSKIKEEIIPSYKIIKDVSRHNIKRTVEVLLPSKVEEEVLIKISDEIKNNSSSNYERTFIGFTFEKWANKSDWAQVRYDPDREVRIMGLSIDAENAIRSSKNNEDKKIIGSWLEDRAGSGAKHILYDDKGKLLLYSKYHGSNKPLITIIKKLEKTKRGRKLVEAEENGFGEYFLISSSGDLEFWSKESGNYYTAKAIAK